MKLYIGLAGWNIRREDTKLFPVDGSHLERYSSLFNTVEINSAFYKDHKGSTYRRWANAVPEDFRFTVKLSKNYTHAHKLSLTDEHLKEILSSISELGPKLASLLIQLPPSLVFDADKSGAFFTFAKANFSFPISLEPRHISWNTSSALKLIDEFDLASVTADPVVVPTTPRTNSKLIYNRLHGSPKIYKSSYSNRELLARLSNTIKLKPKQALFIFDNTALGHATTNALTLKNMLKNFMVSRRGENVTANL